MLTCRSRLNLKMRLQRTTGTLIAVSRKISCTQFPGIALFCVLFFEPSFDCSVGSGIHRGPSPLWPLILTLNDRSMPTHLIFSDKAGRSFRATSKYAPCLQYTLQSKLRSTMKTHYEIQTHILTQGRRNCAHTTAATRYCCAADIGQVFNLLRSHLPRSHLVRQSPTNSSQQEEVQVRQSRRQCICRADSYPTFVGYQQHAEFRYVNPLSPCRHWCQCCLIV